MGGGGGSVRVVAMVWVLVLGLQLVQARGPPEQNERIDAKQIVRVGETLRLSCPVEASPSPHISWAKDNENIHSGWDDRMKETRESLRIKGVIEADSGRYVCTAVNGFGSISLIYYIWVHPDVNETLSPPPGFGQDPEIIDNTGSRQGDPPQWSRPDQMTKRSHLLPMGSALRLKCRAMGRPKPQIIWYKDGHVLPESHIQQRGDRDDDQKWTLKLLNVQEDDSGLYTCKVFNRAGAINFTYSVEVIDRLSKPIIIDPHPYNITVMYGQVASFQCHVHSQVEPTIEWLKRVDYISDIRHKNNTITMEGQQFVVLKTGKVVSRSDGSHLNKLNIYGATESDSGMYICLAANSMGYNIRSAFLIVLPDPNRQPQPDHYSSLLSTPSLPIIIAISAVIIVIVIITIICLLRRKSRGSSANSSTSSKASVLRQPPPTHRIPLAPQNDLGIKPYDHQYAAMHPQLQPFLHTAPSREPIVKNYPDMHSDISIQKTVSPVPMGQPYYNHNHMQVHPPQHHHIHYNMT